MPTKATWDIISGYWLKDSKIKSKKERAPLDDAVVKRLNRYPNAFSRIKPPGSNPYEIRCDT